MHFAFPGPNFPCFHRTLLRCQIQPPWPADHTWWKRWLRELNTRVSGWSLTRGSWDPTKAKVSTGLHFEQLFYPSLKQAVAGGQRYWKTKPAAHPHRLVQEIIEGQYTYQIACTWSLTSTMLVRAWRKEITFWKFSPSPASKPWLSCRTNLSFSRAIISLLISDTPALWCSMF